MPARRRKRTPLWRLPIVGVLVAVLLAAGTISTNAFGVGERFEHLLKRVELAVNPPPDRPVAETVTVTPPPLTAGDPGAASSPAAATGTRKPTPTPKPVRKPVDVKIDADPRAVFSHQATKEWCAVAGTQMVLTILGKGDKSDAFQRRLAGRIGEWESWRDSHNGDWGPAAIAAALAAYGAPEYQIRAYPTRAGALHDAAAALTKTKKPVVLIAWRGAHTWIMSGYRADADPTIFPDATVTGTYILDPWYPWVSSIWGPSDPPGTFQNAAEMRRNFLPWQRPEGRYPDRDGKFIVLVPTR